jgi:hypothetical protein
MWASIIGQKEKARNVMVTQLVIEYSIVEDAAIGTTFLF